MHSEILEFLEKNKLVEYTDTQKAIFGMYAVTDNFHLILPRLSGATTALMSILLYEISRLYNFSKVTKEKGRSLIGILTGSLYYFNDIIYNIQNTLDKANGLFFYTKKKNDYFELKNPNTRYVVGIKIMHSRLLFVGCDFDVILAENLFKEDLRRDFYHLQKDPNNTNKKVVCIETV